MNFILIAIFFVALSLFSFTAFKSIGFGMLLNPDALMIVGGGTIVALFLGFPLKRLRKTVLDVIETFHVKRSNQETAREILEITRIFRKANIRGLEKKIKYSDDDFLKMGINLLINRKTSEEIRNIMEKSLSMRMMDFHFSESVLRTVARLTPSFGLAGTVISLIKMFQNMESLDTIAPHMAVAMMSTFYGVIAANLFMVPLCAKLEEHANQSETRMHSIIDGIESINNNDHPLNIEDKINGYSVKWEWQNIQLTPNSATEAVKK